MDRLVTYAILAEIREKKSNITSLIDIYQELVESLIANRNLKDENMGLLKDLIYSFHQKYHLEIPYPTMKMILKKISQEKGEAFQLFTDFSFKISPGLFTNLEKDFNNEEKEFEELNRIFKEYCKIKNYPINTELVNLIEKNKQELICFLTQNDDFVVDCDHDLEIFANIMKNPYYSKYLVKLILGSLISSFLTLDLKDDNIKKTFLLDTNFVVSLFDLHSEEAFITCSTIVKIAKKCKYNLLVLPETINEIKNLIRRKSENMNNFYLFYGQIDHSIEGGCLRRNISSSELRIYETKAEDIIQNLGIDIIDFQINEQYKKLALKSNIYEILLKRTFNKDGILHDAVAQVYVSSFRSGNEESFSEIKSFFVTDTRGYHENKINAGTKLPLMIRAEELLNILWLTCPIADNLVLQSNISRIMALSLEKHLPDKEMLKRIDFRIQKFSKIPFSEKDCLDLAMNISKEDTNQLEQLIDEEEDSIFIEKFSELLMKARKDKSIKEEDTKKDFDITLKLFQENEKMKQIDKENKIISNFDVKLMETKKDDLRKLINSDNDKISLITHIKKDITKSINGWFIFIVLTLIAVNTYLLIYLTKKFIVPNWENISPYSILIPFLPFILSLLLILLFGKTINPSDALIFLKKKLFFKGLTKVNRLDQQITDLTSEIYSYEMELKQYII